MGIFGSSVLFYFSATWSLNTFSLWLPVHERFGLLRKFVVVRRWQQNHMQNDSKSCGFSINIPSCRISVRPGQNTSPPTQFVMGCWLSMSAQFWTFSGWMNEKCLVAGRSWKKTTEKSTCAKNPGCQSRGYMFWGVNFIWWRLGTAGKTQDVSLLFKVVYMFWRVITFRCIDARISFDGHWAKPKRHRMSVWCLHVLTR